VLFQLRYELSRRQRLIPHIRIWGPFAFIIPLGLIGGLYLTVFGAWWFILPTLGCAWLFRPLLIGFADVLLHRKVKMDLQVEENGVGLLIGTERWWLFLDSFLSIEQLTKGVWTLKQWHGYVLHIPMAAITEEQLAHFRAGIERRNRPEQVQEVIERGRTIMRLKEKH
jgi:hypothetical protein